MEGKEESVGDPPMPDEGDGTNAISTRHSSRKRKTEDTSYINEMSSESEHNTNALSSLDGLQLNEQICNIIKRMPPSASEPYSSENDKYPSYRELAALVSFLGIRALKSRRKEDMVNAIFARCGDLWPLLYSQAHRVVFSSEQKVDHRGRNKGSKSLGMLHNSSLRRTPYNSRQAEILEELYISPQQTWDDILMTSTPDEARKMLYTFTCICPGEEETEQNAFANDSLVISLLRGPSEVTDFALSNYLEAAITLESMTKIFHDSNVVDLGENSLTAKEKQPN